MSRAKSNNRPDSDKNYKIRNIPLLIFDLMLLPIHMVRTMLIYLWGSKYNLRGFQFLDVIMHADNPYFNQEDCRVIDTIGKDYRVVIRDDSRIFPMDINDYFGFERTVNNNEKERGGDEQVIIGSTTRKNDDIWDISTEEFEEEFSDKKNRDRKRSNRKYNYRSNKHRRESVSDLESDSEIETDSFSDSYSESDENENDSIDSRTVDSQLVNNTVSNSSDNIKNIMSKIESIDTEDIVSKLIEANNIKNEIVVPDIEDDTENNKNDLSNVRVSSLKNTLLKKLDDKQSRPIDERVKGVNYFDDDQVKDNSSHSSILVKKRDKDIVDSVMDELMSAFD